MLIKSWWSVSISTWVASGLIGLLLGAGFGFGWVYSLGYRWGNAPSRGGDAVAIHQGMGIGDAPAPVVMSNTLQPGDRLPQLIVKRWLNATPPTIGQSCGPVLVLDLWANWCPYCEATAPDLVQVSAKYQPQGVVFMSLTTESEETVQRMIDKLGITWPNGCDASLETIRNLGARNEQQANVAGYEVKPTLYVVGRDGRISWSDQHMRYRHEPAAAIRAALEAAVEDALSQSMANGVSLKPMTPPSHARRGQFDIAYWRTSSRPLLFRIPHPSQIQP